MVSHIHIRIFLTVSESLIETLRNMLLQLLIAFLSIAYSLRANGSELVVESDLHPAVRGLMNTFRRDESREAEAGLKIGEESYPVDWKL